MESDEKKSSTDASETQLPFVGQERLNEILQIYKSLGLQSMGEYPGADQYSRQLQRVSLFHYSNVTYTTSGSSASPFKK